MLSYNSCTHTHNDIYTDDVSHRERWEIKHIHSLAYSLTDCRTRSLCRHSLMASGRQTDNTFIVALINTNTI